ncbi:MULTISPECIES: GNAT family N-acetyltransferase [Pseudomonas syringae group]|uniref:GNAT family N-acetyltransferase n=1 Tax=Pseudomonas syringae group TaxID=136849 RepID=UPI0013041C5F|nr:MULTISPECIES: GNAT family N-acetyltransferase [Pseudomonas syringae group]MDU8357454.1 GNAT family N-acetyltransferase [Pseudomonas syringae group sp. J309-1]
MAAFELPQHVETLRLVLVQPSPELAQPLADALNASYALHHDFLTWSKPHWSVDETRESLERGRDGLVLSGQEKRYFLLLRQCSPTVVGCIGLTPEDNEADGFEVGYWVHQAYAGNGLMREALRALVVHLDQAPLRLTTSSANFASQRLAEVVGFTCTQRIVGARRSEKFGLCDTLVYHRPTHQPPAV